MTVFPSLNHAVGGDDFVARHGSVSLRSTRTCCHIGPTNPKGLTCAVVLGRRMVLFVFYEGLEKSG